MRLKTLLLFCFVFIDFSRGIRRDVRNEENTIETLSIPDGDEDQQHSTTLRIKPTSPKEVRSLYPNGDLYFYCRRKIL